MEGKQYNLRSRKCIHEISNNKKKLNNLNNANSTFLRSYPLRSHCKFIGKSSSTSKLSLEKSNCVIDQNTELKLTHTNHKIYLDNLKPIKRLKLSQSDDSVRQSKNYITSKISNTGSCTSFLSEGLRWLATNKTTTTPNQCFARATGNSEPKHQKNSRIKPQQITHNLGTKGHHNHNSTTNHNSDNKVIEDPSSPTNPSPIGKYQKAERRQIGRIVTRLIASSSSAVPTTSRDRPGKKGIPIPTKFNPPKKRFKVSNQPPPSSPPDIKESGIEPKTSSNHKKLNFMRPRAPRSNHRNPSPTPSEPSQSVSSSEEVKEVPPHNKQRKQPDKNEGKNNATSAAVKFHLPKLIQNKLPISLGGSKNLPHPEDSDEDIFFDALGKSPYRIDDIRNGDVGTSSAHSPTYHQVQDGSDSEMEDYSDTEFKSQVLPPHLLGAALGSKVQLLLHKTMASGSSSSGHHIFTKVQQLLVDMEPSKNESLQVQACSDICQLLLMGNEESLIGFPVVTAVKSLILLLKDETHNNFELMNQACRALTYMMEALPRSITFVASDGIAIFLKKLQEIQCMDVAEQSLTALEMLSKKHGKTIMLRGGISCCLGYVDFFSMTAQRAAFSIVANCCTHVSTKDFANISASLPIMLGRLSSMQDKKIVESCSIGYSRLIESFRDDLANLQEIASQEYLSSIQNLLTTSPPILSGNTFSLTVRSLHLMIRGCPLVAITLLKSDITATLKFLLTGPEKIYISPSKDLAIPLDYFTRTPQELLEITSLIGELMPQLPSRPEDPLYVNDLFNLNQNLEPTSTGLERKDKQQQLTLESQHHLYVAQPEGLQAVSALFETLVPLICKIYDSSPGHCVRYRCLQALLRMIYHAPNDVALRVLTSIDTSSYLAAMLSSKDAKIILGSLQLCEILLTKFPETFITNFKREGVLHQLQKLIQDHKPKDKYLNNENVVTPSRREGSDPPLGSGSKQHDPKRTDVIQPFPERSSALSKGDKGCSEFTEGLWSFLRDEKHNAPVSNERPPTPKSASQLALVRNKYLPPIVTHMLPPLPPPHRLFLAPPWEWLRPLGKGMYPLLPPVIQPFLTLDSILASNNNRRSLNATIRPLPQPAPPIHAKKDMSFKGSTCNKVVGVRQHFRDLLSNNGHRAMSPEDCLASQSCSALMPPPFSMQPRDLVQYYGLPPPPPLNLPQPKAVAATLPAQQISKDWPAPSATINSHEFLRDWPNDIVACGPSCSTKRSTNILVPSPNYKTQSTAPEASGKKVPNFPTKKIQPVQTKQTATSTDATKVNYCPKNERATSPTPQESGPKPSCTTTASSHNSLWDCVYLKADRLLNGHLSSISPILPSAPQKISTPATSSTLVEGAQDDFLASFVTLVKDLTQSSSITYARPGAGASMKESVLPGLLSLARLLKPASDLQAQPSSNGTDASPFEIIQSALPASLLLFLTASNNFGHEIDAFRAEENDLRLKTFAYAFANCPPPEYSSHAMHATDILYSQSDENRASVFQTLITKLLVCLSQLEQFNDAKVRSRNTPKDLTDIIKYRLRPSYFDDLNSSSEPYFKSVRNRMGPYHNDKATTQQQQLSNESDAFNSNSRKDYRKKLQQLDDCFFFGPDTKIYLQPINNASNGVRLSLVLDTTLASIKDLLQRANPHTTSTAEYNKQARINYELRSRQSDPFSYPLLNVYLNAPNSRDKRKSTTEQPPPQTHNNKLQTSSAAAAAAAASKSPSLLSSLFQNGIEKITSHKNGQNKPKGPRKKTEGGERIGKDLYFEVAYRGMSAPVPCTTEDTLLVTQIVMRLLIINDAGTVDKGYLGQKSGSSYKNPSAKFDDVRRPDTECSDIWNFRNHLTRGFKDSREPPKDKGNYKKGSSTAAPNDKAHNNLDGSSGHHKSSREKYVRSRKTTGPGPNDIIIRYSIEPTQSSDQLSDDNPLLDTTLSQKCGNMDQRNGAKIHKHSLHAVIKQDATLFATPKQDQQNVTKDNQNLESSSSSLDPSITIIKLLRILHALNRSWGQLYDAVFYSMLIPESEFVSRKLTSKVNRHLQSIATAINPSSLPRWITDLAYNCPFLFPFETRRMLFYLTSFDRARALQKLSEFDPAASSTLSATFDYNSIEPIGQRSLEATLLDIIEQRRIQPDQVAAMVEPKRRKIILSRSSQILKQAERFFDRITESELKAYQLEVEYEGEVGTGLGPTLEFYSLVSRDFINLGKDLWRCTKTHPEENVTSYNPESNEMNIQRSMAEVTLYPHPYHPSHTLKEDKYKEVFSKFDFLGKFIAKALIDSKMVDLSFSPIFFQNIMNEHDTRHASISPSDLRWVDSDLASSYAHLMSLSAKISSRERSPNDNQQQAAQVENSESLHELVSDLCLDFTLPGHSNYELVQSGKQMAVTSTNLTQYLELILHHTIKHGITRQVEAFKRGFESVFPLSKLSCFYPDELDRLLCGDQDTFWEESYILSSIKPDHGYTSESRVIQDLAQTLASLGHEERRNFAQFLTGSPRLPIGGLKNLNPPITVVRKSIDPNTNPDNYLPSVMTCVNYLKLPEYSSVEVMKAKLRMAIAEGLHCFHLS